MRVPCDAGADDDGRRALEPLVGEIDRLDSLDAFQLVDGQGMAVDTVTAEKCVTWPNITHPSKLLAHLREHRLGSSLIAAMSAFSPSMFPLKQMKFPATL